VCIYNIGLEAWYISMIIKKQFPWWERCICSRSTYQHRVDLDCSGRCKV